MADHRPSTIVVVGAGLAGATVVTTLREEGWTGRLVLLGDETHLPYERPPLSKDLLLGTGAPDDVLVHDSAHYDEHDVELLLGDPATAIDRSSTTVRTASGATIPYDRVVLATGARPRRLPGVDAAPVLALRTLDDARALDAGLSTASHVTVVGAGWIGCEVAAAARSRGVGVTLVDPLDVPLRRVLGPAMGRVFADLHAANGVDLRLGCGVSGVAAAPSGGATVRLDDGSELSTDLVVTGIGVVPNTALAQSAGLPVADGVHVDGGLRTPDPRVLAAGDVANHDHPLFGRLRVEHWANARHQGRVAAHNALGAREVFDRVPYFFSDQYDLGMEYAGVGAPTDEVVVRGDVAAREFVVFWLRDGVVTAGMNVNVWDVTEHVQRLVAARAPVERTLLEDPDVPLAELGEAAARR